MLLYKTHKEREREREREKDEGSNMLLPYVQWAYALMRMDEIFFFFHFFPDGWVVIQPASLMHIHPASQGNFLCWTPPLGTSDTLTVVKENGLEMRKLWPAKIKEVENSLQTKKTQKQTKEHYHKKLLLAHSEKFLVCLLLCCSYSSSKLICRASGGVPITLLIVF
jgi:hypothetical protein